MTQRQARISWVDGAGGPLGAHVNHDERSKNYPFEPARSVRLKKKSHHNYGPPLQQGPVGACTGFTGANFMNTKPYRPKKKWPLFKNIDGFTFYSEATKIDPWTGAWIFPPPPGSGEDTGSDALSVCKVLQRMGLITGYRWTFGLEHTLEALMVTPIMIGIEWYEGFDEPDNSGHVKLSGEQRGRHEFLLLGCNPKKNLVVGMNSWGRWGLRGEGYFTFTIDDLGYLLERQGDAVIPEFL